MALHARIRCKCCAFRHANHKCTPSRDRQIGPGFQRFPPGIPSKRGQPMADIAQPAETSWNDGTIPARSVGWALASLSLATLLSSLGTSIASVGLPSLMQAFGASFQSVQWVVLAYLLAITALIVSAGRLADMVGRRPLLLGGIALYTAASALCALA